MGKDGSRTFFTEANSGLTNDSVMALTFDKYGTLWAATYLDGLFTYTPATGFRPFADQDAIGSKNVVCLAYDAGKDLMYVGTYGAGLAILSPASRKVERTISQDLIKWVSTLMIDKEGTVWLGTFNGPLCYNHELGKLWNYDAENVALQARVYCFCEAENGVVWIGTGEGLTACDGVRGTTRFYSEADGLPNNVVAAIREAADGTLWVSTANGLSHLNPASETFTNYYVYDGLQGNEFHFGAAFRDADGQLLFGGIGGVTLFYPQVVSQKPHAVPPVSFSRLTVQNQEVDYDASREVNILDKHITEATRIDLPYKQNTFSLEFAVLEYTNPRKIRYAYQLDRFDDGWHTASPSARIATYTNLPSGRYTLTVKAYFDGNEDAFSSRSIKIRVRAPWYLSAWAFLIYALMLAAGILLMREIHRRRASHKKERKASEIKDLKLQMFTNISHEIRTPLTLLMSPLKQMREAEEDPQKKGQYNLMYRNSLRILRLVNQLMDMRKVDEGKMQLHFLETDVVYFIRDIMQSFDDMAVSRDIDLTLEPARAVENLWIDQGNFDKIVFNLLSNAFKHTPDGGTITIGVSAPKTNPGILPADIKEFVRMDITNSGSRLEAGDQDKIFERFFQSHVLDAKVGSGVGLSLTKMLVELHHGAIEAYNTSSGVRFSVYIPVGCAHLSELEMSKTSHHKDLYTKYPTSDDLTRSTEDLAFTPASDASDEEVKSRRHLVIVDDDSEIRDYLLNEFRGKYNVKTFPDAASAWADISVQVPDVVVTDLKMEGMDGIELCEKIKHNPGTNHIAVIILTSSADEATQQRSVDSGADRFLSKPLSIDLLKGSIANILQARETLRRIFLPDESVRSLVVFIHIPHSFRTQQIGQGQFTLTCLLMYAAVFQNRIPQAFPIPVPAEELFLLDIRQPQFLLTVSRRIPPGMIHEIGVPTFPDNGENFDFRPRMEVVHVRIRRISRQFQLFLKRVEYIQDHDWILVGHLKILGCKVVRFTSLDGWTACHAIADHVVRTESQQSGIQQNLHGNALRRPLAVQQIGGGLRQLEPAHRGSPLSATYWVT